MSQPPFRFLHASDLHLERPLLGLAEIPDHLRQLLLDAPYLAAQRVFDAALAEQVDFVVLAGDVMQVQMAGPRGIVFLVEQFQRLAKHGIAVYWAGGQVDAPETWPATFRLPSNVHLFPGRRPDEIVHQRDGQPIARLGGASAGAGQKIRAADFWPDKTGLFSIAIAHGTADPALLAARQIHYWALGGAHRRATRGETSSVVHYPGTTQGREPSEIGAHGCTLVEVDGQGQAHLRLVPTDRVRWRREPIDAGSLSRGDVERLLQERSRSLAASAPGIDWLVTWILAASGQLAGELRKGMLAAELLGNLRAEFGLGSPAVWSVSLAVEAAQAAPDEWYGQDTLLGHFLRAVDRLGSGRHSSDAHREEPLDVSLDLEHYLSPQHAAGRLGQAVRLNDEEMRARVLRQAAALGADLLCPEESKS